MAVSFTRSVFALGTLLILSLPTHSASASKNRQATAAPKIAWAFETKKDSVLLPHTKVFLAGPHGRILIQSNVNAEFHTLERSDFAEYKIPAVALTACSGFFAGQGEDLYVLRHGKQLRVMMRQTDEQAPTTPYKLLKTITRL